MEERNTRIRNAVLLAAGLLGASATAAYAERFTEWAQVVSSTPVVQRTSQPREECWTETIWTSETRKLSGISLGAFETSTNVAVPVQRDVQRCRTVEGHTDVIQGYDVRYRYQGREYVTRLASPPGDRIPVEVTVAPGAPVLSGMR